MINAATPISPGAVRFGKLIRNTDREQVLLGDSLKLYEKGMELVTRQPIKSGTYGDGKPVQFEPSIVDALEQQGLDVHIALDFVEHQGDRARVIDVSLAKDEQPLADTTQRIVVRELKYASVADAIDKAIEAHVDNFTKGFDPIRKRLLNYY